jgi:hypothetical protein
MLYYDRNGKRISFEQWAKRFNDPRYKIVQQEYTPKKQFRISTVWLGIDHSFGLRGNNILIFETMVFRHAWPWYQMPKVWFRRMRGKLSSYHYFENIDFWLGPQNFEICDEYDCIRADTEEHALENHAELLKKWTEIE